MINPLLHQEIAGGPPETEGCLLRLVGMVAAIALCAALAAMLVIPTHATAGATARRTNFHD